jgi:hypothetical protein
MADVLRRKTDLVHQALDSAVSRLNESTDATPFAAIGELLFWVVASDEVLRASNLG